MLPSRQKLQTGIDASTDWHKQSPFVSPRTTIAGTEKVSDSPTFAIVIPNVGVVWFLACLIESETPRKKASPTSDIAAPMGPDMWNVSLIDDSFIPYNQRAYRWLGGVQAANRSIGFFFS
jgi:hypothetical protein